MSARKLVVLGSVNADHVLHVENFPRPGETVSGYGYQVIPGGKGANQAVAAARTGADIFFIACVGDDDFGRAIVRKFKNDNINTQGVMQIKGHPTGIAIIYIAANGENSIGISPEANGLLTPERLSGHLPVIHQADTLLMQLETPLDTITLAAEEARKAETRVVLNPAPARAIPDALLANISMITPNETEAEILSGIKVKDEKDAAKAANFFHEKGVETVIITLGSRGAFVSTESESTLIPGFNVKATDTTAAGDTFNGALMSALQGGKPLSTAICFAHAAAALSVTRTGAQTSIPYREEVEKFLTEQQ